MASYAENLIGKWETEQYEPLRQVAQDKYKANWDKLSTDYNNLNEQLAQNFTNARKQYNNAILQNSKNAYNRMYNAEADLADRGLTGSGMMNVYNALNTEQHGQENNAALEELMKANEATIKGRFTALDDLAKGNLDLIQDLGKELAGITDAEGDNYKTYRDLIGSLNESRSSRASSYANANAERELEEDEMEFYRKLGILKTLNNEDIDEYEKKLLLINTYDMPLLDAEKALESYKYKTVEDSLLKAIDKKFNSKKHRKYAKELSNYTYTDLWELMNK